MEVLRLVVVCVLCMMCLGCGGLKDVPLVWKPTSDPYADLSGSSPTFPDHRFKVIPFSDNRENKTEIARNVESSDPKLVTTKDDVSQWCTARFKEILQLQGFNMVETGETVQLRGEVVQFHVLEDTRYKGTVGLKITAETPDKGRIWQGLVTGTVKRFGRSYSQENYYETLSDAYLEAVQNLFKDESFVKALQAGK